MIAYNPLGLDNLFIREQATGALRHNLLGKKEWESINEQYPVHFYSPNLFIRIGLFVLTVVIMLFSFGLLMLLFLDSIEKFIGGMAVFFALLCYAGLEYMVQIKKHLQSGVDDAMLWASAGSLFGGISYLTGAGDIANCMIIFVISLYCCCRFADRLMGIVMYLAFTGIFFFSLSRLGINSMAIVPFVLMVIAAIIYIVVKRAGRLTINQLYSDCLKIISVSALLGFYLSGNYYVVREVSIAMFNTGRTGIPFGWFFWLITVLVPCIYLFTGIRKKDLVLIRVGLFLVAVMVCTLRYYYFATPVELVLVAGGIACVVVSYILTRYLEFPKYGYTSIDDYSEEEQGKSQIESIVVAQTFSGQPANTEGTTFGGGGYGGGGASGEY